MNPYIFLLFLVAGYGYGEGVIRRKVGGYVRRVCGLACGGLPARLMIFDSAIRKWVKHISAFGSDMSCIKYKLLYYLFGAAIAS